MALQLALGCVDGVHRQCVCCPKPFINFYNVNSTNLDYEIIDADYATITYQCGTDAAVETEIDLVDGYATGNYTTVDVECLVTIVASNECGTTVRYWRNYATPEQCDCIVDDNDPPNSWQIAGGILVTISGTTSPVQIETGGIILCPSPAACGDPTGSVAFYCPQPNRKFVVTSYTGCGTYYFYIDILIIASYGNWPGTPGFGFQVEIRSGLFQRASGGNPYPTLTEYTGTFSGAGVPSWETSLSPAITNRSERYVRSVAGGQGSAKPFAGGAGFMLACYTGSMSVASDTNNGVTDTGHCDCGGLTITAEVV